LDIAEEIVAIHDKINVGNYESLDLHVSFSRDIDPGESVEEAFDSVFLEVIKQLDDKKQKWGIDFLNKSKAQFEDEIEVFKNKRSDRDKAIKLKAQKEGNIVLTPKWYAKVER